MREHMFGKHVKFVLMVYIDFVCLPFVLKGNLAYFKIRCGNPMSAQKEVIKDQLKYLGIKPNITLALF